MGVLGQLDKIIPSKPSLLLPLKHKPVEKQVVIPLAPSRRAVAVQSPFVLAVPAVVDVVAPEIENPHKKIISAMIVSTSSGVAIPAEAIARIPKFTRNNEPFYLGPGLLLVSDYLTPEFLKRGYSASVNNAIWRIELWRLTMGSVLMHHPVLGYPLGTSINLAVFAPEDFMENVDLHNSHLAFLFRFGFVGLTIYLSIIFAAGRSFIRMAKYNSLGVFILRVYFLRCFLGRLTSCGKGRFAGRCFGFFWVAELPMRTRRGDRV